MAVETECEPLWAGKGHMCVVEWNLCDHDNHNAHHDADRQAVAAAQSA